MGRPPVLRPQLRRDSLGRGETTPHHTQSPLQPPMLYLVIERFRDGDAVPVYRRFRDHGRLAPEGLRYVASWVTSDFRRCFQIMECEHRELIDEWTARWKDLVDFEVTPVMTSADAVAAITPRL